MSAKIKFICSNFRKKKKSETLVGFSDLFYIDNVQCTDRPSCVYPVLSKSAKQLSSCLQIAETKVFPIVFNSVLYHVRVIHLPFLTVALHESGTRKYIFWSVTTNVYSKNPSRQCNLTAQIEPVQYKYDSHSCKCFN